MAEVGKINIGDFTQLIILKEPVKTKGDKAQVVTNYVEKCRLYADISLNPASEATVNDNVISVKKISITTYSVLQNYINSKWVVEWLNEIYDIQVVAPVKGTIYMTIDAIKMLNNG
jgi:head-tail adaptor